MSTMNRIGCSAALLLSLAVTLPAAWAASTGEPAAEQVAPEDRLKRNQLSAATDIGDAEFKTEQSKGLSGDRDAAVRVAQMFKTGSNGVPKDERRMVQWLLHASQLNSGAASYQLYQYFLDQRLDRDAVFFENRAIEQGFTPRRAWTRAGADRLLRFGVTPHRQGGVVVVAFSTTREHASFEQP